MRKIYLLIVVLIASLITGCTVKSSKVDSKEVLRLFETDLNKISSSLISNGYNIEVQTPEVVYYNWEEIWGLDNKKYPKYLEKITAYIDIECSKSNMKLIQEYQMFDGGYRLYYSFSFFENNVEDINLIEIDLQNDIELIKLLCKECNIDLDKFLVLENKFNKNNLINNFNQNKVIVEKVNYYTETYKLNDFGYEYSILQDKETGSFEFNYTFLNCEKICYL